MDIGSQYVIAKLSVLYDYKMSKSFSLNMQAVGLTSYFGGGGRGRWVIIGQRRDRELLTWFFHGSADDPRGPTAPPQRLCRLSAPLQTRLSWDH